MKKALTVYILIALFFVSEKLNSQKYNWSKSFSSIANSEEPSANGSFIKTCSNGDMIVVGTFKAIVDLDPSIATMNITSNGNLDIFILKISANGNFIWVKQLGGNAEDGLYGLEIDSSENLIITGYFVGSIDLNPGPELNIINADMFSFNSFILKLNSEGEFVWEKHFLGNSDAIQNWIGFASLEVSNNGDIMLTGQYRGTVNVNPMGNPFILTSQGLFDWLVLKIDSTGQFVYAFRVGSEGADLYALLIELLPNGSFLLVGGNNTSNVDIDPGSSEVIFINKPFIGFYNSEAQLIWSQSLYTDFQPDFEGARCVAYDITKNSSGEFFLAGTSNNGFTVFDISGSPQTLSSAGGASSFFIKIDSLGNKIWLKSFYNQENSGTYHRDFVLENDTNLYLTGLYSGLNDFNPGEDELILPYEVLNCTYIVCLNAQTGIFKWARNTQGSPLSTVYVQAITSNSSNNTISLTGFIYESVDLNPGVGSAEHISSPESLGDIFLLNMGLCDNSINININDSFCDGGNYLFADDQLMTPGLYSKTFLSFYGCDSTVNLNLSVIPQPEQPQITCYQTATFNNQTCAWVLTGTQPTEPPTACYQTATFNNQSCAWDLMGTQPTEPPTACYQTATFNNKTCAWDVTGTQPTEPPAACYQTATFNNQSCAWDVTGTQPTEPPTACYQTATFNNQTCAWDVTGTQPTEPPTACYQTATFNTQTCAWDVTGTQPTEPPTACYQTATFNNQTCAWDVTGTQPTEPPTACYQTATFNAQTCTWVLTGTQPTQPPTACYQTATFNTQTCAWDVTGSPNPVAVTTASACSSYVWTVNGQSYTSSNTYTYFANCQDYQLNLTINPNPSVSFSPDNTTYCDNSGSVELSGGSPSGGVYSGPGVSNGEFNPATAGGGLHSITYTYTNANGCTGSETVEYEVAVCTGVEASGQPALEVRPNPMESSTWVSLKNYTGNDVQFNLLLMDATGRKVFEKQIAAEAIREGYQLHIPELASGTYVLMLNNADYSGVKRLVK